MSRDAEIGRYRIVDEPRSGLLSRIAMPPIIPFIVVMLFWPWGFAVFALNSFALNGPTKWREFWLCVGAVVFAIVLIIALGGAVQAELITGRSIPYLRIGATAVSLWFGYKIFITQKTTHDLRNYFKSLQGRA